jgi:hypothetical protein
MSKLGFRCTKSDSGIFVLSGQSSPAVICIIYVDDAIFMGPDICLVDKSKATFINLWECRDLGETKEFLWMNIHCQGKIIVLEQKDYLKKVLEHFNMHNAKSIPTPLPIGYVPMPNPDNVDEQLRMCYQQIIGSLLYLMLRTCPDILFAMTKMLQFASNPMEEHYNCALYICCYLVGTTDYALTYSKDNTSLITYADVD